MPPDETEFYGREDEQRRLRGLLDDVLASARADRASWAHVAFVHGMGGIGKSTLLRRFDDLLCGRLTDQTYRGRFTVVRLNWETQRDNTPERFPFDTGPGLDTVLAALHRACCDAGLSAQLKAYRNVDAQRNKVVRKVRAVLSPPDRDRRGSSRTEQVLAALLQVAPTVGLPAVPAPEKVAALVQVGLDQARVLVDQVNDQLRGMLSAEEFALLNDPAQALVDSFADGLRSVRTPLAVLMDTCEIVSPVGPWLRRLMSRCGPRVAWIMAGRAEDEHQGLAGELGALRREVTPGDRLRSIPISRFSEENLAAYLGQVAPDRPVTADDLDGLYGATRGIPLAVRTAARFWRDDVPLADITSGVPAASDRETLAQRMTERFLHHLRGTSRDRDRLLALALAHRPDDVELLCALWDVPDAGAVLRELADRHDFVFTGTLRLHEVMGEVFRDYLLDPVHRAEVRAANQRAIDLLEKRLVERNDRFATLEERCEDERWSSIVSALAWHRFWDDNEAGWDTALSTLPAALAYDPTLCDVLLGYAARLAGTATRRERQWLRILRDGLASEQALVIFSQRPRTDRPQPDDGCERERAAILAWRRATTPDREPAARLESLRYAARTMPRASERLKESVGVELTVLASRLSDVPGVPDGEIAVQAATLATELQPSDPRPWRALRNVLVAAGRHERALVAADRVVELDSATVSSLLWRIRALQDLERYDEALAEVLRAIALEPESEASHWWHATILRDLKRYDEALPAAERAVALEPGDSYNYACRGETLWYLGRYAEALMDFDRAIGIDPASAGHHRWRGNALLDLGRNEEAVAAFDRAIEIDPGYSTPYTGRGVALSELGHEERAWADFTHAMEIDPDNMMAVSNVAYALGESGRVEEALELVDRALLRHSEAASLHRRRGFLLMRRGDLSAAEPELLEAVRLECDGLSSIQFMLGVISWCQERYDQARERFTDAIADSRANWIRPTFFRRAHDVAVALCCLGEPERAIDKVRDALSQRLPGESDDTWLYDLLAASPIPPPGIGELRRLTQDRP